MTPYFKYQVDVYERKREAVLQLSQNPGWWEVDRLELRGPQLSGKEVQASSYPGLGKGQATSSCGLAKGQDDSTPGFGRQGQTKGNFPMAGRNRSGPKDRGGGVTNAHRRSQSRHSMPPAWRGTSLGREANGSGSNCSWCHFNS